MEKYEWSSSVFLDLRNAFDNIEEKMFWNK